MRSEQRGEVGGKLGGTELTAVPEFLNFTFTWASANSLLCQRGVKAKPLCMGVISPADVKEKK
jgi:hypothetical protein